MSEEVGAIGRPPSHYQGAGGLDPFAVIDAFGLDFYEGNAVKYILRWRKKNGVQDLQKARHYLDEAILRAENGTNANPTPDGRDGGRDRGS